MEIRTGILRSMWPAVVLPPVLLTGLVYFELPYGSILSMLIVGLGILPFFAAFERSRPRPRDMVPIAVMSALGALGRALFAAVPNFKPTSAIVIITGMQFGPSAGFLTGALSALASNLFLGQGPWTPWQMYAWGMIGFLAGLLQKKNWFRHRAVLYGFGLASGFLFGWFLNLQYLIGYVQPLTWNAFLLSCGTSLVFDAAHGASTVIFLLILEKPWGKKLKRLKTKYGILEEKEEENCI